MKISRRKVVVLGASAVSASLLPLNLFAQSDGQSAEDIIKEFTGGANIGSGDIMLTTPEIAENGNTVPISVESKKATAIKILALGNPGPDVVTFKFVVPLFVRSQHHRHRTWSYNEISRRYTDRDLRFYEAQEFRTQHKSNRQASNVEELIQPYIKVRYPECSTTSDILASSIVKQHHQDSVKLFDNLYSGSNKSS